jgi:CheY-like chemotaxis protein
MSRPILVVDDDLDILEAMRFLLEGAGFVVLTATDGEIALHLLRHGAAPCLILLDLMMPIMNGWRFLTEVRHDPLLAAIPIVVLSGCVFRGEEVMSLGVAGYLKKPVDVATLISMVRVQTGQDDGVRV